MLTTRFLSSMEKRLVQMPWHFVCLTCGRYHRLPTEKTGIGKDIEVPECGQCEIPLHLMVGGSGLVEESIQGIYPPTILSEIASWFSLPDTVYSTSPTPPQKTEQQNTANTQT